MKAVKSSNIKYLTGVVVVIAIAIFFRFYKLLELQYYSFDDELAGAMMWRFLVNKKLMLLGTTATLDIPLGSFWYWLSAPVYKLVNFNPVALLTFGSALGVMSTYWMYWVGKRLGNNRIGLLASLLYAGSFLTALLDRRWWILSINPIFVMLAIYALKRMIDGKLRWALPLVVTVSFAWHGDPTLAIIPVAAIISFLAFRLPVKTRDYIPALIWLLASLSPLLVFELRHPGAITTPYLKLFSRLSQSGGWGYEHPDRWLTPAQVILGMARGFWAKPTQTAEDYLYPFSDSSSLDFSWAVKVTILVLILWPMYLLKKDRQVRKTLAVVYIFVAAFLIGIIVVNSVAKVRVALHYYLTIWPVLFLLSAFTLDWLVKQRQRLIVVAFLGVFLATNFNALAKSRMQYTLTDKMKLMAWVADNLEPKPFSFYPLEDVHLYGGGLGGILMMHKLFPSNRSYYGFDWTYQAFSLYQVPVVDEDKFDQRVVVYPDWLEPDWTVYEGVVPVQNFQTGKMKAAILRPIGGGDD